MTAQDYVTNSIVGLASLILIVIPVLRAQCVNGYTLLLLIGTLSIFMLAWFGRRVTVT